MKPYISLSLVASLSFSLGIYASNAYQQTQEPKDNKELAEIYKQDQADRQGDFTPERIEALNKNDKIRLARVGTLVKEGKIKTKNDFFHAAMVFQHAPDKDGYKMAHELAVIAAMKGHNAGPWLSAASWDRFLLSLDEKQRFGTQYSMTNNKLTLSPIDEYVTDDMRKEYKCPTLQEAKDRAKKSGDSPD